MKTKTGKNRLFAAAGAALAVLLLLALVPVLGGRAHAEHYSVYSYEVVDDKVTITDVDDDAEGILLVPGDLNSCPVTKIADSAFAYCTEITEVFLPGTVTEIGESAFYNCSKLGRVRIPSGVTEIKEYTFYGCSALASVELPDSVTGIGNYAFGGCTALASVTMPLKSVTEIGNGAFQGCESLTEIALPGGLTEIADYTFYNCSSLTSVDIPWGVTRIGNTAFRNCSRLASVQLPSTLKTLEVDAFAFCTALPEIELPYGLKTIGQSAFYDCTSLTKLAIPRTVKSIGIWAFRGCALESAVIPQSVTAAGDEIFNYCPALTDIWCVAAEKPDGWSEYWKGVNSAAVHWGEIPAPTDVTAKGLTAGGIKVSWTLSDGATRYNVYRKTAGGNWARIAYSYDDSFTDTIAEAGTLYYYRIQAQVSKTTSAYSANASARWLEAPAAPTLTNYTSGIKAVWGEVEGATIYYVWRAEGGGAFAKIGSSRTTSYVDKTAVAGKTYRYAVKARVSDTYSALGAEAKTVRLETPAVTIKAYASGLKLTWETVPGATLYNIWRASPGGGYEK
ncbi:MAG: leucine-rich repeat protein, partial [Oscillospiraceae bacterium]|nr:leucine-rich repeat protein [Oscillospiraceae bacterium]